MPKSKKRASKKRTAKKAVKKVSRETPMTAQEKVRARLNQGK